MKPTFNYLVALALLTIIACAYAPLAFVVPIAVLFAFSLAGFLAQLNYDREMMNDFQGEE